jgi:hypothetical protein
VGKETERDDVGWGLVESEMRCKVRVRVRFAARVTSDYTLHTTHG